MLNGPALVAAVLLALAGAQKLVDPTMTVGALRALGLAASPWLVRAGAGTELLVGALALSIGGGALWVIVSLSYVLFAAVVVAASRRGSMIGTCGCFGRQETPPHPLHVVLNVGFAAAAAVAAAAGHEGLGELPRPLFERLGTGLLLVLAVGLAYTCYVAVPRLLAASTALRDLDLRAERSTTS